MNLRFVLRISKTKPGKCEVIFDVDNRLKILEKLERQAAEPGFWNDQSKAKSVIEETNRQKQSTNPYNKICRLIDDAEVMLELAEAEVDDKHIEAAQKEIAGMLETTHTLYENLEVQALLSERFDACNAYISLHAGAGGTESCDWADMLFRMYRRYCDEHGLKTEVLDYQAGDEAGTKSATLYVQGDFAFGYLKAERGVHRLVRISPFDTNKRRHTSFAALDVVPEVADDIEVEIKETDIRIDTYRSSGSGGQHVNKTDSAIRITHMPSGIVVACQTDRSQHRNKDKAFKMLRAKLYEWQADQKKREMERFYSKKGEIAWGSQIRSYVMQPYTLVKDHRTGCETSNVANVLDGHLDDFIKAYLKHSAGKQNAGSATVQAKEGQ